MKLEEKIALSNSIDTFSSKCQIEGEKGMVEKRSGGFYRLQQESKEKGKQTGA